MQFRSTLFCKFIYKYLGWKKVESFFFSDLAMIDRRSGDMESYHLINVSWATAIQKMGEKSLYDIFYFLKHKLWAIEANNEFVKLLQRPSGNIKDKYDVLGGVEGECVFLVITMSWHTGGSLNGVVTCIIYFFITGYHSRKRNMSLSNENANLTLCLK